MPADTQTFCYRLGVLGSNRKNGNIRRVFCDNLFQAFHRIQRDVRVNHFNLLLSGVFTGSQIRVKGGDDFKFVLTPGRIFE